MTPPRECPNGHPLISPNVLRGMSLPCDCVNANGHHHDTYQCKKCLTVLYDPPCPKWDASKAETRRVAAEIAAGRMAPLRRPVGLDRPESGDS